MNDPSHWIVCFSISVAIGESTKAPQLLLITEAIRSPSIPIGAGDEVIYPQNRGWPFNRLFSKSRFHVSLNNAEGSVPIRGICVGSFAFKEPGFGAGVTWEFAMEDRKLAISSISRCPSSRKTAGFILIDESRCSDVSSFKKDFIL